MGWVVHAMGKGGKYTFVITILYNSIVTVTIIYQKRQALDI